MLKTYKLQILLVLGVLYSVAVWHVSERYHAAGWEREKKELVQKALETTVQRQELANLIGTQLETKLGNFKVTQTTIHQKVLHEVVKEPVYRDCRTTDAGVRLIDEALRNQ